MSTFDHNVAATLESAKPTLKPLCTAGHGWEKDLRVSTPVLPSTQCGLTPAAAKTENFQELKLPALETEHPAQTDARAPAAKLTPHFEIKNAETIEDGKNG